MRCWTRLLLLLLPIACRTLPDGPRSPGPTGTGTGTATTGSATGGECTGPAQCLGAYGEAPCGSWECNEGACEVNCPGCTDGDRDGYGPEEACAGRDCDDADDTVFSDVTEAPCYDGPPGTEGVGACRAGRASCLDGVWTACRGQVLPGGEACNDQDDDCDGSVDEDLAPFTCGFGACQVTVDACGPGGVLQSCSPDLSLAAPDDDCDGVDDDCDGAVDEACVGGCVWVAPTGEDATADGSLASPYASIQAAIGAADPAAGQFVCVAVGPTCEDQAEYVGSFTMREGVHVYGGYETTGSTRCGNWNTILRTDTPEGVLFDGSIGALTILDGVRIDRPGFTTTAGITVDGATGVRLIDIRMPLNENTGIRHSYGVNIVNGGEATLTRMSLFAGKGRVDSVAVRVVDSRVTVRDNCDSLDSRGDCDDLCPLDQDDLSLGFAGRERYYATAERVHLVLLQNSPGSVVEQSALCSLWSDRAAGVAIEGDAEGVVIRKNHILGQGGQFQSDGVLARDCGGTAPWIVDNHMIRGEAWQVGSEASGVRAEGDCPLVIQANQELSGGADVLTDLAHGVYCLAGDTGPSRCAVLDNPKILGGANDYPYQTAAVRCGEGSCNRIEGNSIDGGPRGTHTIGVWLEATGVLVSDNTIAGGCADDSAVGILAEDAHARIENNWIRGGGCNHDSTGIEAVAASGLRELDVHSNLIDAGGSDQDCRGVGLALDVDPDDPPAGPKGVYRNNILRSGPCDLFIHYDLMELTTEADPRVFSHNLLDPADGPTALYWDADAGAGLSTAAEVDALGFVGTVAADPLFVQYPPDWHLRPGSPCIGAGTPEGAPAIDADGDPRDPLAPDIGPDERR